MVASYDAVLGDAGWHSYTGSAMPIYEYRCERGHTFEVMQKMTDDPVMSCTRCEAPVQRVFHPVAVHFKGKGFYNTDYGTKRRNREMERSGKDGGEKSESKSKESADSSKSSDSSKKSEKSSSSRKADAA
jgi:putative FmdB family regulatory protein